MLYQLLLLKIYDSCSYQWQSKNLKKDSHPNISSSGPFFLWLLIPERKTSSLIIYSGAMLGVSKTILRVCDWLERLRGIRTAVILTAKGYRLKTSKWYMGAKPRRPDESFLMWSFSGVTGICLIFLAMTFDNTCKVFVSLGSSPEIWCPGLLLGVQSHRHGASMWLT